MEMLLNVFGKDQPGLVADLTEILYEHNVNLGDADMTRIGGTFALIMAFTVDNGSLQDIKNNLEQYSTEHDVVINTVPEEGFQGKWGREEADTIITVYGADHPGIVYRVSRLLGEQRSNICNLSSSRQDDEKTYIMVLEVKRPGDVPLAQIEDQMDELAKEIEVQINVRELESLHL